MTPPLPLDQLPGFRRRFRVASGPGWVRSAVEDDYHCMRVTIHHDGLRATGVQGEMPRAPWTTCPGAVAQLQQTFKGVALNAFAVRGEKTANCTHLHDLATLAAAHALDAEPLVYDIVVSDPVDGQRHAEIRRDGKRVLGWIEAGFHIVEPAEIAGTRLDQLRLWIESLAPELQEPARLLRWGNILANGRQIPLDKQSDARRMPSNCYTFQPERKTIAKRVGAIRDFSKEEAEPLDAVVV